MKISYLGNLTSTFLLLTSFFCVQSAPARPLNERSTEFAWVILDEQQSDSSPRRKITPKSIFISPSFGTQSCSTGYTLDANGRCVKVVKLDTSAHEQFVLELLNQNFGDNYDEYDDDGDEGVGEALPTPGPVQFNIPLGMDADKDKISIIVAPTNGNFEDSMKIEDKKASQLDAPLIITNISIKDDLLPVSDNQSRLQANRTTTSSVLITTTRTSLRHAQTDAIAESTLSSTVATTYGEDDATAITTDADGSTTTLEPALLPHAQEQQAIFFKLPGAGSAATEGSGPRPEVAVAQSALSTTNRSMMPFSSRRPAFDEALLQDFLLQDRKKQVNRRFVTKAGAVSLSSSEDALYSNHRNRDRWLFPRFADEHRRTHR